MNAVLKIVFFWIFIKSSSCWLLPHETERKGNSRPIALAKQVSANGCETIRRCLHELRTLPQNSNRLAFTLLGQGLGRLVVSSKLQNSIIEEAGDFYPYTSHLIELYSATDGIHYTDGEHSLQELWMFPNYFLLSLEEAVEIYQDFPRDTLRNPSLYPQIDEYRSIRLEELDPSYFPIMASGMGDYIFIDLSNGRIIEYVPTFGQSSDDEDNENGDNQNYNFSSILMFLKEILNQFKNDKYHTVSGVAVERDVGLVETEVAGYMIGSSEGHNAISVNEDYDVNGDSQRRSAKAVQRLYNRHGMPLLNLNCRGMGMICNFIQHSIEDHGSQRTLCKVKRKANTKTSNRMTCGPVKRIRGSDCNQFPFESTHHSSSQASERRVSLVPTVELNVLGGQIRAFYRATEISTRPRKRCFKLVSP